MAVCVRTSVPGPKSQALLLAEQNYLAPGIQQISTLAGIAVAGGDGAIIEDVDGNRFLDWVAGIGVASIGHGHKALAQALSQQAASIVATSFASPARLELLARIVEHAPHPSLNRVQLYSSGAEAVESALRLARAATGHSEVLAFWGGFHGKTLGVLGLMGSEWKHGLLPVVPGQHLAPYGDCRSCALRLSPDRCRMACIDFLRDQIRLSTANRLAAIVVEPIQGTAGNVVPHPSFLPALAQVAHEHGALLVVDEMITGFGRTGDLWASTAAGVVPDIVTFGKGVAAGFPLSGLITRAELAASRPWADPSHSSSSFGGNPLACAAANATTRIIIDENLSENARRVGERLFAKLTELHARFGCLSGLRGRGLMLGFDLVSDGKLWPKDRCLALFRACLSRGLLTMAYTPRVRINPPLVLSLAQADESIHIFADALASVA